MPASPPPFLFHFNIWCGSWLRRKRTSTKFLAVAEAKFTLHVSLSDQISVLFTLHNLLAWRCCGFPTTSPGVHTLHAFSPGGIPTVSVPKMYCEKYNWLVNDNTMYCWCTRGHKTVSTCLYDVSINLQMQQQLVCFGRHMAHTITDSSAPRVPLHPFLALWLAVAPWQSADI